MYKCEIMNEQQNIENLIEDYERQAEIDVGAGWEKLQKRIRRNRNTTRFIGFVRNSAAILLPLFLIFQYVVNPAIRQSVQDKQVITLSAAPGMVVKAILPDGSQVWLNSQSEITYPQVFNKKTRSVKLSGEAYFKVSSDPEHRFNVEMPDGTTVSAYGTEFNVNSYATEENSEVTLAEGNLELSSSKGVESRILKVDEKAIIDNRTGEIETFPTDTYVDTAWKDGRMVFRRAKLDKIAERLERKFGVSIQLKDEKLKEYEYTATFTDETLEDILDLLQMSAPIRYTIKRQEQLENETYTHREVIITLNA